MKKRIIFILMIILVIISVVFYILSIPKNKGVSHEDKDFKIGYIPDNMTIVTDKENVFGINKNYEDTNDSDKYLFIDLYNIETMGNVSIDTEDAIITDITINGYAAQTVEKYDNVAILWSDENTFYMVDGNIGKEECIKIAESISYEIK